MRCPSCNKFPALELQDPEFEAIDDSEGLDEVTVTARIVRTSECCGDECKEATFEVSCEPQVSEPPEGVELDKYDPAHCPAQKPERVEGDETAADEVEAGPCEFEWTDPDGSGTERTETKDRHGKPIKSSRYMTSYFGVEFTAEGTCRHCGGRVEVSGSDEVPASGMDELV